MVIHVSVFTLLCVFVCVCVCLALFERLYVLSFVFVVVYQCAHRWYTSAATPLF